jgi:hypothetical protein
MLFDVVGGRVYGFTALKSDLDERDFKGCGKARSWPNLDFAFNSRLAEAH